MTTPPPRSRRGRSNYSTMDVSSLLDFVDEVQPLGANMWSLVEQKFNEWAKSVGRPTREEGSLKSKFDKMANTKKSTGDPSCPPEIRRAKHVARDLLAAAQAAVLGDDGGSEEPSEEEHADEDESDDVTGAAADGIEVQTNTPAARLPVAGGRVRKRPHGAAGIALPRREDPLVESVRTVAEKMCDLTDVFVKQDQEDLQKMVKKEVAELAKETKASIAELKEFIKGLLK